jgi:hypothetical protein
VSSNTALCEFASAEKACKVDPPDNSTTYLAPDVACPTAVKHRMHTQTARETGRFNMGIPLGSEMDADERLSIAWKVRRRQKQIYLKMILLWVEETFTCSGDLSFRADAFR